MSGTSLLILVGKADIQGTDNARRTIDRQRQFFTLPGRSDLISRFFTCLHLIGCAAVDVQQSVAELSGDSALQWLYISKHLLQRGNIPFVNRIEIV